MVIYKELKRNTQRVPTTLGGGQLGYLGLILEPSVYITIPGAARFDRPTDPGIFNPTSQITQRSTRSTSSNVSTSSTGSGNTSGTSTTLTSEQIATQKAMHDESVRLYHECQRVEVALRNQLIEAIEPIYLKPLRNKNTDMINDSIPTIIAFLNKRYGKISDPQLVEKERELLEFTWDIDEQPDTAFNEVDNFANICEIVGQALTDRKKVQLAYCLFQRVAVYRDALMQWNSKTANNTYDDFKDFMRDEHDKLEEVGALKINDSNLNNINIIKTINEKHDELSQRLEERLKVNFIESLASYGNIEQDCHRCPTIDTATDSSLTSNIFESSANNIASDTMLEKIMKEFRELKDRVETLANGQPTSQVTSRKRGKDINPRTGKPYRRYCWSCGCCNHWGRFCPNKKRGHQDDATFKDRKGGSNKDCIGS